MARSDRIKGKLKRFRSFEAGYRRDVKLAERASAKGSISRERLHRIRARLDMKIDRLSTRIRELIRMQG